MSRKLPTAYLDNNATTMMPKAVQDAMIAWVNRGNPSASYASAVQCKKMMQDFRDYIAACIGAPLSDYDCVFTSGATESNCTIIQSIIERCRCANPGRGAKFHVVASHIEHKSIILMLKDLMARIPEMDVTFVSPSPSGHINAADVRRALRADTQMVICMHANNETGAIMNIAEIGRAVKEFNQQIFFHCDIVQSFGKVHINLMRANVDGAAISFHKLHGPPGVGAMIMRRAFANTTCPLLYGTQSSGRRGGTENVPGIGASFKATQLAISSIGATVAHELELKKWLIEELRSRAPVAYFDDYARGGQRYELQIIIMGSASILDSTQYLPNTILLSVAKHVGKNHACNTLIKQKLEDQRIIVSVGSACSTESSEPSHVLSAMGASTLITDGAIRVSMCAYTSREDVKRFLDCFLREAREQYEAARKRGI